MEYNEYDLPSNVQVPIWLLGLMITGFVVSLWGWELFVPAMIVTSIISLLALFFTNKKRSGGK